MAWADRSPLEQAALNYCAPQGIPLSVFLGRVVYPGDPAWLDDDRDAVFDWQIEQNRLCKGCGQDLAVAMKEENTFAYRAEGLWCHGCRAIHRAAAGLAGRKDEDPLAGTRYRFTATPGRGSS